MKTNIVYNEDCLNGLKRFSDNYFDLAIIDPPYGLDEANGKNASRGRPFNKLNSKSKAIIASKNYGIKHWDKEPASEEYFKELFRVSKNQIIFGANHFISRIPYDSSCWIVWDKDNGNNDFADCELAWTSFKTAVRKFKYRWNGLLQENMKNKEIRIHPTQKPIALYEWLLTKYGQDCNLILDTHVGSGSSRIACHRLNKDFIGFELDNDHYKAQEKRYKDFISQLSIF